MSSADPLRLQPVQPQRCDRERRSVSRKGFTLHQYCAICQICGSSCHTACTQFPPNDREKSMTGDRQWSSCSHRPASCQPHQSFSSTSRPMVEAALMTTAGTLLTPVETTPTERNGSCLFAAGSPTDTVGCQNVQPFSTRQTPHLGD